jgi:hypothetical protein
MLYQAATYSQVADDGQLAQSLHSSYSPCVNRQCRPDILLFASGVDGARLVAVCRLCGACVRSSQSRLRCRARLFFCVFLLIYFYTYPTFCINIYFLLTFLEHGRRGKATADAWLSAINE